jgi:predicted ATPase
MFISNLKLQNFLSYGPEGMEIPLNNLNVFIGANGSGKSNLIEALALLRSAPNLLTTPIREGGGVSDWLWKGSNPTPTASIEAVIETENRLEDARKPLRYRIDFTESNKRFEVIDELIESAESSQPCSFFKYENNHPVISIRSNRDKKDRAATTIRRDVLDPEKSILAQFRDPESYPEITFLANEFEKIRIYREWSFGRYTPPRLPQKADLQNTYLDEDCRNLGLVLNSLKRNILAKEKLLSLFRNIYDGVEDLDVIIEGGSVQVFVQEGNISIPATRLSDGTLRYLCLLAILCHPTPPPLICIEEPELGLHPDLISTLAKAMQEASARTQLIVTTHSVQLIDSLTNTPESVIICEKHEGSTVLERLDKDKLSPWLKNYQGLGTLMSGKCRNERQHAQNCGLRRAQSSL